MRRLPIRLRLTLAFTGVMALLLVATGLFLYLRLGAQLDHTLEQSLRSRTGDVSALVQQADKGLSDAVRTRSGDVGASPAQILDSTGRVFDATPGFQRRPLITPAEVRQLGAGSRFFDRTHVSGPVRLLATPIHAQGHKLVMVVGASLEDRNQALAGLGTLLLIGGPLALVLAALAGYGLATGALRPVESMRARAAAISAEDVDKRLPVSGSHDELHRLGETLNAMLARLEAGLARERTFVADASHELRTPLAMLRTELELIVRDHPEGKELDAAIASASAEADRLASLTEDLLVLARADRGGISIVPETIRLRDLLEAIARRYSGTGVEAHASELDLEADRARLEQALTNMIDNALRHGADPIRMSAVRWDGYVELHVTDRGPGFAPEFLPRAFERFARADAGRCAAGAGLGLAIVREIAIAHGGSAHAANLADGGADVWIRIPSNSSGTVIQAEVELHQQVNAAPPGVRAARRRRWARYRHALEPARIREQLRFWGPPRRARPVRTGKDRSADAHVRLHLLALLRAELSGFEQNLVGHAYLANVV